MSCAMMMRTSGCRDFNSTHSVVAGDNDDDEEEVEGLTRKKNFVLSFRKFHRQFSAAAPSYPFTILLLVSCTRHHQGRRGPGAEDGHRI